MDFKVYIGIVFLVAASGATADEYEWTSKNINFFPSAEAACRDTVLRQLVYCLKINFSHACVVIAARARCILFKISSPLAFQT
ncbi:putative secreted protein [Pseudomonas syringae group genomosp. 3]|uniref:Putative secreted protein n=1 Tax=Pseudomonas syringae group genomosp. 3 TaxID=251701 RepID=A0A2K4WF08_9PSED|nr:putative secreted protein [Pseudomonas syringae group genomosp. 3]SPF18802.1 putative secreted protein [Pseudomonas syringae group genomosp. 3]